MADSEFGRYVVLATYLPTLLATDSEVGRNADPFAVDAACIITRDAAGVWVPLYTVLACTSGFLFAARWQVRLARL